MTKRCRFRTAAAFVAATVLALAHGPAPAHAQQAPFKSWSKPIPKAEQRFKVLSGFANEAVLDKETGLVWERAPASLLVPWAYASDVCFNRRTGGRMGWRLPAIEELTSLLDATSDPPVLPVGHPFQVEDAPYWSATSYVGVQDFPLLDGMAWRVQSPTTVGVPTQVNKLSTTKANVWCLRGGSGYDSGPSGPG